MTKRAAIVAIAVVGLIVSAHALTADFDGDGVVGFGDFFAFAEAFGSAQARFDLDGSGRVDLGDFFLFAEQFGRREGEDVRMTWENGPPKDPAFFPIAVWLQAPRLASRYKEAGINLYVGL